MSQEKFPSVVAEFETAIGIHANRFEGHFALELIGPRLLLILISPERILEVERLRSSKVSDAPIPSGL